MNRTPRNVVRGVLALSLLTTGVGCPYFGPIEPEVLETSFDPVISVVAPTQTEGLVFSQADGSVSFEVFVTDEDNKPSELMFFWILNETVVDDGPNLREFQLQLNAAGVQASNKLVIRVFDPKNNEAEKQWLFDVQ